MVLIETSWNVKILAKVVNQEELVVLIETSWNVKVEWLGQQFLDDAGINRNIVECKVGCVELSH